MDFPASNGRPTEPLRVLQFVNTLEFGGATDYALTLCEHLDPIRFRTWLAAGPGSGWEARAAECNEDVLHLRTMKPTHTRESGNTVIGDVRAFVELVRFLRRERIDIVHNHGSKSRLMGGLAGWVARVPYRVQSAHGFAFNSRMKPWKHRLFKALERLMGRLHHELVLESRYDLDAARRHTLARRTTCIYTGVTFGAEPSPVERTRLRAELGIAPEALVVMMIGRLTPQKDPHTFVEAAKIVRRDRPDVEFVVVGDGDLYESTAAIAGHDPGIHMLGRRTDVPQLIAMSDVYMLCSRWEGIPLTILAAMHARKPIVATDKLGLPEVVVAGETGLLAPEGDADAYANAVLRLAGEPELRTRLGEDGRRLVTERHSLSGMIEAFERLFECGSTRSESERSVVVSRRSDDVAR